MARHSKWHNIKKRKGAQDALKGKVYAIHSKLISIAAQKGGDKDKNPTLYDAIQSAKAENVPNEIIERAIKKGSGENQGEIITTLTYEGYAAGGVAIVITVLTDNRNRTASNIRHIFTKYGGSMGESGSVSWIFHKKGVLTFDSQKTNYAQLEELVFETSAEDIKNEDGTIRIITAPETLTGVKKFFVEKGYTPENSGTEFIPNNFTEVSEFEKALKITKMIEALDADEDVEDYALNYNIGENLQKEVDEFIEKNTFRT